MQDYAIVMVIAPAPIMVAPGHPELPPVLLLPTGMAPIRRPAPLGVVPSPRHRRPAIAGRRAIGRGCAVAVLRRVPKVLRVVRVPCLRVLLRSPVAAGARRPAGSGAIAAPVGRRRLTVAACAARCKTAVSSDGCMWLTATAENSAARGTARHAASRASSPRHATDSRRAAYLERPTPTD